MLTIIARSTHKVVSIVRVVVIIVVVVVVSWKLKQLAMQ